MRPATQRPLSNAIPARRTGAGPVILLIDDDSEVRESLARVFASEGMTVVTAANAAEGIAHLATSTPDLVITDLCMAGINGWDVLFHEKMERPNLPLFVITGLGANDTGGADKFATEFFQKPLDLDAVMGAVRNQLQILDTSTEAARAA